MAGQGEAANGYRVYQQNQAKKKAGAVPVNAGTVQGAGYEGGRMGEVAAGQAHKDYGYAGAAKAQEDDFRMRQSLGLIDAYGRPPQAPPATSYHGSGGGGGGGGGSAGPRPAYDPAELDKLLALVNGAGATDRAAAGTAYDGLDQYLSGLSDPYAHIQPAAVSQVDPTALSNLIRSQGGGDAGLRAQAQYLQANNGAAAAASDRLAQMLSATQQSWNQGTQADAKLARQQTDSDLASQLLAMQAAIQAKKTVMR